MSSSTPNNARNNASSHYLDEKGKAYFAYQNEGGLQQGRIEARKFAPYIEEKDRVLDFGCGNGGLLYNLNCAARIGIDVNPAALETTSQMGIEAYNTLEAVANKSVEKVISNHALEHVLSPCATLVALHAKLVDQGRLILCVPLDDWRAQQYINPKEINHHLYTWTPLLLGNLLTEAGFVVERAWVITHAWPPRFWKQLDALLPIPLFDVVCYFTAIRYRRRQIMAIARKG